MKLSKTSILFCYTEKQLIELTKVQVELIELTKVFNVCLLILIYIT